ncbi:unnamed protein product [Adineta steineri]|uniref:HAT C-terminal dimerisation domain-containing protein n=1 Tax=Adineta steineri TaxID=433720 RepID=A0A814JL60_9BILA|nr:unnamed protein product [Adineta steineri]CAF3825841.1 unnamed protein product [Adineta steineri]
MTKNKKNIQRQECVELIKQEILLFDVDDRNQSPEPRRKSPLRTNASTRCMIDFYSNAEDDEDDDIAQNIALRSSAHALEIEVYIKQGSGESTKILDSLEEAEEYNPLSFWKKMYSSYSVLLKVAARIIGVLASSAAVEREFSLVGNIIT